MGFNALVPLRYTNSYNSYRCAKTNENSRTDIPGQVLVCVRYGSFFSRFFEDFEVLENVAERLFNDLHISPN